MQHDMKSKTTSDTHVPCGELSNIPTPHSLLRVATCSHLVATSEDPYLNLLPLLTAHLPPSPTPFYPRPSSNSCTVPPTIITNSMCHLHCYQKDTGCNLARLQHVNHWHDPAVSLRRKTLKWNQAGTLQFYSLCAKLEHCDVRFENHNLQYCRACLKDSGRARAEFFQKSGRYTGITDHSFYSGSTRGSIWLPVLLASQESWLYW